LYGVFALFGDFNLNIFEFQDGQWYEILEIEGVQFDLPQRVDQQF